MGHSLGKSQQVNGFDLLRKKNQQVVNPREKGSKRRRNCLKGGKDQRSCSAVPFIESKGGRKEIPSVSKRPGGSNFEEIERNFRRKRK